ncbi:hypothetical protein [Brevundimonas sp.]|uniref:hypothetical protein n=1 Tax=Brevundimonas sp. TaxID=1871086 RepID=UPI003AF8C5C7
MKPVVLSLIAALAAGPVLAQEPDAWTSQTADDLTLAYAVFPEGIAVIARCQAGTPELLVQGLQIRAPQIDVAARFGDGRVHWASWAPSDNGRYLIAERPAQLMRGFVNTRAAMLQFGEGDGAVQFTLTPPADTSGMEGVLTACGQPLFHERDEAEPLRLSQEEDFLREGRVIISPRAARDRVSGWAYVTCMTAEGGRLTDCEAEAESPAGYGYGEASVRSLEESRIRGEVPPGRLVSIRLTTMVE